MSDTLFSSLSPNSSNDLSNRYIEESDLNDQETASIISNFDNENIANLDDFNDVYDKWKLDPFLSDFVKDEYDDIVFSSDKLKFTSFNDNLSSQQFLESNDINFCLYSLPSQDDLDEFLPVTANSLDEVPLDSVEWADLPPVLKSTEQKLLFSPSINNKRSFLDQDNHNLLSNSVPNKQIKFEISPQIRCQEWVSKLNQNKEHLSFKVSGLLDRRKTKHHQILKDYDTDLYEEKKDLKISTNNIAPSAIPSSDSVKLNSAKKQISISVLPNRNFQFNSISASRNSNHKVFSISKKTLKERHVNSTKTVLSQINKSYKSNQDFSEISDIPRIPQSLRMGKTVSCRGHRFSLWQFLMFLLDSSNFKEHNTGIKWVQRNSGIFHIIDSKQVAILWGQYKGRRDKMTYDSLARSLRHYYKKNLMAKINNRRLVYQIAQECLQWSSETFMKRNKN